MSDQFPATVAELKQIISQASSSNTPLYPKGGGTKQHYGLPGKPHGLRVNLSGISQILDYPARDMTISVQPGITIQDLQDVLRAENQRLPIDVPLPKQATLGGTIAANISGARRFGFGTLRDYVIGLSVVNGIGHEFKTGGQVVKNVAGYDLCKLLIGSFGTLGILTRVTLTIRPVPEDSSLVGVLCRPERLEKLLNSMHNTRTRPCALELLSPSSAQELLPPDLQELGHTLRRNGSFLFLVGFEANSEAVPWQISQLTAQLEAEGFDVVGSWRGEHHPLWIALRDYPLRPSVFTFHASIPSSSVSEFVLLALANVPHLQVHAGNGIVIGHADEDFSQELLLKLRQYAETLGGSLTLLQCPESWRKPNLLWGKTRANHSLMQRVKQQLDPHAIFNTGRFLLG